MRLYKTLQHLQIFFHMNLLINKIYCDYIDSYTHIYTPNQAFRVAKLCLLLFFS